MSRSNGYADDFGIPRASPCASDHSRRGFTLIELLVSTFVLAIGLLALTGASAVVARQLGGGAQLTLAATLAQSRFESMRARDCASLESGSARQGELEERWTVARSALVVEVTDTIVTGARHGRRVHAFRTLLPCPDAR